MGNAKSIIFFTILFVIFLFPFSISLSNDDGASANYLFLSFPICVALYDRFFVRPKTFWLIIISIFLIILPIATVYQTNYLTFLPRRVVSFVLFMSIFSFMFIRINLNMILAFKYSLITISIIFSALTLIKFITLGASDLGFEAKGEVGSQRFGFVYVITLWILFFDTYLIKILRNGLIVVIIFGLLLTFSRSGIVAMIVTFFLLSLNSIFLWLKAPNSKGIFIAISFIVFFVLLLTFINVQYPIIFDFFYERLFSYFEKDSEVQIDLNEDSSEGYRVFMLLKVLDFVFFNPITGAGYLGVWVLFDDHSGSAHGQFVDVLFRTGFLGLTLYIIILFKLLTYFYKENKGYFWGLVGVIVYGFFHETFKLSQGSFILAFLIALASQNFRYTHNRI